MGRARPLPRLSPGLWVRRDAAAWPGGGLAPPAPRSKPALRHHTREQTRTHVLHPILRGGDRGGRHEGPRSYGVFASEGRGEREGRRRGHLTVQVRTAGGESQATVPSDEASPSGTCCRIP